MIKESVLSRLRALLARQSSVHSCFRAMLALKSARLR